MRKFFLAAAVIGAIIPCIFFINFTQLNGIDVSVFIGSLFVNGAAGGFTADLLISSFVFWAFMFQQQKRVNGPAAWIFIALNLGIGLSCALPAYLYACERTNSRESA
jgi:hypothetical protein